MTTPLFHERERRARRARDLLQALNRAELQDAGAKRKQALGEAEGQLDRIARRLAGALRAGLSLTEVSQLTGVSRPTLYQLKERRGRSERADDLDVLATLSTSGPITLDQLADELGADRDEVARVVGSLAAKAHVATATAGYNPSTTLSYLIVTQDGEDALEALVSGLEQMSFATGRPGPG